MIPDSRQHIPELAALTGWRQVVAEAKDEPWLAGLLARQGARVYRRFVYFYHRLVLRPGQRQRWQRRLGMSLAAVALLLALSGSPTGASPGAVIVVDGAICKLADAITAANTDTATGGCPAGSGADTINLQVDVNLTSKLPDIASTITIDGNGHTVERTGGEVFNVLAAAESGNCDLTLNHATISGGGIGILNAFGGKMTLNECVITGNQNLGGLFGFNTGGGGGIYNFYGKLEVNDSVISGNRANFGAGLYVYGGSVTVRNSLISGNSAAEGFGGGVRELLAQGLMVNSTISGNLGYGVSLNGITVVNSTISGNLGYGVGARTHISNSIVANQASGTDCNGTSLITSDGYNIASDASCAFTAPTDQQNVTAQQLKLGALADNGGATKTMALAPGSEAIDRIRIGINGCGTEVTIDQRGEQRPGDGNRDGLAACDVGAYELQPLTATIWLPIVLHQP